MNEPDNKGSAALVARDPETKQLLPGGASLNPGGRPKLIRAFQQALQDKCYDVAVDALKECLASADGRVRMAAIKEVFDRLFGRAPQAISVTGEDGGPVQLDVRAALLASVSKLVEAK